MLLPKAIVAVDSTLYVADYGRSVIYIVNSGTGVVSLFAGQVGVVGRADATGASATFNSPSGICYAADMSTLCTSGLSQRARSAQKKFSASS